ncbi:MAG: TOTE conflict system archaeo-eukaryotic primase domain-containing protein [Bilifractor sp.]|jgi:superfamily II DNA or RNA helicase
MSVDSDKTTEEQIKNLLDEIADLKKENTRLRRLLKDHGIKTDLPDHRAAYDLDQGKRILPYSVDKKTANQFFSKFWGRMDVYSQRVVNKSGRVGYYPQCWNFWKPGCARKPENKDKGKRGSVCINCPMQAWKKIDLKVLEDHLTGKMVIGIYPLLEDDTCRFLVFDFDNHSSGAEGLDFANQDEDWRQEVDAVRDMCMDNNIDPLVERSRSGRGAHIWIFFDQPISASLARDFGEALLDKGAESVNLKSFQYYDRMVPGQSYLKNGGLGNLIALPLQPEALKNGNSAFIDTNWNAYPDQFEILRSKPKLKENEVKDFIRKWREEDPFADKSVTEEHKAQYSKEKPWNRTMIFHASDVHGIVRITEGSLLYIDTGGLMPRIQNQIRRLAAFSNPVFYKNQAMNLSNFSNSRYVYLGEDIDGYIAIPKGLLEPLIENFRSAEIPYILEDVRLSGRKINVTFNGSLRKNQEDAVRKMLEYDQGILSAATAFGKTVVCCSLIAARKTNTLILLESSALIDQWVEALKKFLDINEELPEYQTKTGRIRRRKDLIGILQGAKDTTTGIVDVAMVVSLCGKKGFHPRMQDYGMVILDECHHAASETIQKILREIKAKYVYGVTATPIREDGLEKINYMLIGPIRFRFSSKERAKEQGIEHVVYPRFTRCVSPRDSRLGINDAYELIRDDELRNEQIEQDVRKCINKGRSPVILTRYKEHAEKLYQELNGYAKHTFLLLGDQSYKEKKAQLSEMNGVPQEESVLLIATGKLIGEGFDYPRLDTLIMATPVAGKSVVEQYAGRLNRDYCGKNNVVIYDYIDVHIPVFDRMYGKRLKAYRQIGYQIYQSVCDEQIQEPGFIFDINNYQEPYRQDLLQAKKEIVICSPGLRVKKIESMIHLLKPIQEKGIEITVLTWKMDNDRYGSSEARAVLTEKLREAGVDLRLMEEVNEHFTIIDREIVWYGSVNFLGKEDIEDNLMRIISPEAAGELLEIACTKE